MEHMAAMLAELWLWHTDKVNENKTLICVLKKHIELYISKFFCRSRKCITDDCPRDEPSTEVENCILEPCSSDGTVIMIFLGRIFLSFLSFFVLGIFFHRSVRSQHTSNNSESVRLPFIKTLVDFLNQRTRQVRLSGALPLECDVFSLPRRSVLGSLLSRLFINDLPL